MGLTCIGFITFFARHITVPIVSSARDTMSAADLRRGVAGRCATVTDRCGGAAAARLS